MDCRTARLLFEFDRPASSLAKGGPQAPELEADEAAALAGHLADCPECAALRQAERQADAVLGRAMRDLPIPDGLHERLLARLAPARVAWYRRRAVHSVAGLAAAIALVLAGWHYWNISRTRIDLDEVASRFNTFTTFTTLVSVQDDFREKNIPVELPAQFNYDLLAHYGMRELQGQPLPVLEFRAGKDFLWMFVVDGKRFDLQALAAWQGPSQRVTVSFQLSPDGRFGYILVYTGGSLAPFYARVLPAAA